MVVLQFHRQLAVVYTVPDVIKKVNYMRELGFLEHEIHIFAKNIRKLQSLKMYTEIDVHQSGNLFDMMISVITGTKLHETAIKRFEFSDEELHHYGELIRKGAILIIAQHDFPVEKQPTSFKLKPLPKKIHANQIPSPLNISNKKQLNKTKQIIR